MKKKFILLILLLLTFRSNVFAESKLSRCEVSEEYKKWLALPESERNQFMMPDYCKKLSDTNILNILPDYSISSFSNKVDSTTLSPNFDLRNVNGKSYVTNVKNQKLTGTCWAHAGLSSIESNILKTYNQTYDFSELHLSYSISYNYFNDGVNFEGDSTRVAGGGGHYADTSSYLTKLKGTILESDFPFSNYYDASVGEKYNYNVKTISLSEIQNKTTIADINNIIWYQFDSCTDEALYTIKSYIQEYGAVQASYYSDSTYSNGSYLFHNGNEGTNHSISIVGWDDTISKTKFKSGVRPTNDGAFIIKNSWGTSRGDNGYFYISYEDTNICKKLVAYNNIDFEVEDNIYYYDQLGHWSGTGYGEKTAWAANKFEKKTANKEILTEVTIGTRYNTNYEIYISFADENNVIDLNNRELIGNGNINHKGYGTHKFKEPIIINKDFAIIVKYDAVEYVDPWPVAVQSTSVSGSENTSHIPNQSFVSYSGDYWSDLSEGWVDEGVTYYDVASIKAYTNNIDYDFSIGEVTRREETKDKFNIPITLTNITNQSDKDFNIKVMDFNEVDVTDEFIINDYIKANNYVEIEKKSLDTENGEYKVEITYDLLTYNTTIQVTNSNPTIELGDISYKSNNMYLEDNKIYDLYGGTISIPVTLYGLENNGFSIEIVNMNGIKQDFTVQLNPIVNNETSIQVTIPKNTASGGYTVKVSNSDVTNQISFKVYDFIEVEDITFKYQNEELEEIILLKEDSILVEGIISNQATLTEIDYYVENSTDKQVAILTNDNQIYGNDTGTVNLVAKVGDQQFKIPITVIDVPNITYDNITYISNVSGNNKIDNYFGGKIEIEKTTTNKTDSMMFVGMGNVFGSCISYDYDLENKVVINISGSCGLSGGESLQLDAGNYTYEEKIHVFDTKNTIKKFNADYEIVEYIALESITSNIEKINLKINNTYDLSNNINLTFGSNDATNKNIKYVGYDEEIININDEGTITALKGGITTIKVMSVYNEEIYDTINVMVNPNIKDIETNIESNYNNKLYYGYGGKVTANITTQNIIDNERLTIKYYKDDIEQNDMTSIFDTTNRLISNNETSIDLYVGSNQAIGTYKIELCYQNAECKSFEFEVIEPKDVIGIEAKDIIISNDGTLTNINYQVKPTDAFNQDVEFEVADTSIAKVEDGKIKGLKVGDTTLTIKALDGSNISKTVNVSVVEKSIVIDNIKLENDIIYETIGGKLSFRISLINIDSTKVNLQIIGEDNNDVYNEEVTLNEKGYKDIELNISETIPAGIYTIKVTDGNFEKTTTFEITSYKPVQNIKFYYNQKELSKLVLLNEDEISILSEITNSDATFKDITYSIKDSTIARITEEGLIYGIKVGKTELIASVGFQTFTLPIEIINDSGVTYGSLNIYSNVSGNNYIDNHYGGKYTIEATFDNINSEKEITLNSIILKDSNIRNFGVFEFKANEIKDNKSVLEVTFTEYQSTPGLNSGIFNANGGTYIISYDYPINDTKDSTLKSSFEINLKDFVELSKINLSKSDIKLDINESINISSLFNIEPNNTTNKNVKYEVDNGNILKVNGSTITGLSEGTAKVTITSLENENISATINITVEKNDYLEFSNKVNIHNENGLKYLKGFSANNTYKDLKNNIDTNQTIKLYKNNNLITDSNALIGTGMKLKIGDNNYDIVIRGDLNGDGKQTITDLSQLIYHIAEVKGKIKTGAYLKAGDLNKDNKTSIVDLSRMLKEEAS